MLLSAHMARQQKGIFALADRIVGGQLAELLLDWRKEGFSYPEISLRLHDEYELDISVKTVTRWIAALYAEKEAS